MKRSLLGLLIALAVLALVVIIRTLLNGRDEAEEIKAVSPAHEFSEAADHLAAAIRIPTISQQDTSQVDTTAFRALHELLRRQYPKAFSEVRVETVSELSLLFTWRGSEADLRPVLIMSHQDVVPPGADSLWREPPFGGVAAEGRVWGRGALDDKIGIVAALEAVERLLEEGFRPRRTIYLAFGHDEEVGGARGAAVLADTLASRVPGGLELVLDEGGFVVSGMLDGIGVPVALVGIAEKGYLTLELNARGAGGHSSAPPKVTAVGRVGRAVAKLEDDPFPGRIDGATRAMFDHLGPHMRFSRRLPLSNLWLFEPVVRRVLASDARSAVLIRTTTAATMIDGGVKENVLPTKARAIVNFRILPGETTVSVTERVRRIIGDPEIDIKPINVYFDPSPVSDPETQAFGVVERSIRATVPAERLIVTPYLVPGATDSRYFTGLSDNVFRFLPIMVSREDIETIHGSNERIDAANVSICAAFVYELIRNADAL